MDFESLVQYKDKLVKITLINNFWYRAKIVSVSKECISFVEARGKNVSVSPSAVMMVEEIF